MLLKSCKVQSVSGPPCKNTAAFRIESARGAFCERADSQDFSSVVEVELQVKDSALQALSAQDVGSNFETSRSTVKRLRPACQWGHPKGTIAVAARGNFDVCSHFANFVFLEPSSSKYNAEMIRRIKWHRCTAMAALACPVDHPRVWREDADE